MELKFIVPPSPTISELFLKHEIAHTNLSVYVFTILNP
jgi:hypothetical protein